MMSDLDRVLAMAAALEAGEVELARPYTRVENGKTERVGGYQSSKAAMAAGVHQLYQNRATERGELAHRVAGVLAANHRASDFGQIHANLGQARQLIVQHEGMASHPGIKRSFNNALAAIRNRDRPAFVAAHNELEHHVRGFTVLHAPG